MNLSPDMVGTTEVLTRRKKTALDWAGLIFQILVWILLVLVIISAAGTDKSKGPEERDNKVFGDDDGDIIIYPKSKVYQGPSLYAICDEKALTKNILYL